MGWGGGGGVGGRGTLMVVGGHCPVPLAGAALGMTPISVLCFVSLQFQFSGIYYCFRELGFSVFVLCLVILRRPGGFLFLQFVIFIHYSYMLNHGLLEYTDWELGNYVKIMRSPVFNF